LFFIKNIFFISSYGLSFKNYKDLLIMGPSNEPRFNKPKRPKNVDYSVDDEMRGVGVEGNSSNTTG